MPLLVRIHEKKSIASVAVDLISKYNISELTINPVLPLPALQCTTTTFLGSASNQFAASSQKSATRYRGAGLRGRRRGDEGGKERGRGKRGRGSGREGREKREEGRGEEGMREVGKKRGE